MIELLQCSKRRVILSPEGGESHEEQTKSDRSCSQKGCRTRTSQGRKSDNLLEYLPTKGTRCTGALQEQQIMATAIAERIVGKLIATSVVEEVDRELYVYGFFLLITRFFFFLVTFAFGGLLGIPLESVIFYIVFILLRSYAGGVHAKTEMACTVWTTLAMAASVLGIKAMELTSSNFAVSLILITGSLCIFVFCPLDTKEKPLSSQEKKHYRIVCRLLISLCVAASIIAQSLPLSIVRYSIASGIFLESIFLSLGKLNKFMYETV